MADAGDLSARYRRITRFAARYLVQAWWFELFLPRLGLSRFSARNRTKRLRKVARRFHGLAIDLGGLMIKVGQFMSSRLDVLPPEITKELEGLQDEVPAVPFPAIRALAEAELGVSLDRAFAYVDPTPLAAASLGQAHRATLAPDDAAEAGLTDVVIKIQRPGIDDVVDVDLRALRRVAQWLSRVRLVSDRVDMHALVEEFAHTSLEEIDYLHEAANSERFAADVAGDGRVSVPRIAWERTTRRVLTLEDVTAIKITDVEGLRAAGIDPAEVAIEFASVMFDQLFADGFFHADPHPGNIFVTPHQPVPSLANQPVPGLANQPVPGLANQPVPGLANQPVPELANQPVPELANQPVPGLANQPVPGLANQPVPGLANQPVPELVEGSGGSADAAVRPWHLTFIDFGMMGEVPEGLRRGLRRLLIAAASRDGKGLVDGIRDVGVLLPSADTAELERAMTQLFARFGGMGFAELQEVDPREFRAFAVEFGDVVRSLPFQLPENFLLIIRAMSLVSGNASALDPAFNIWDAVEPYANRLIREESGNVVQGFAKEAVSLAGLAARLPRRFDDLATRIEDGRIAVQTPALARRMSALERMGRRIVSAVLFAALLIAGAVLRVDDAVFGTVLMSISAIPLLHALFAGFTTRGGPN